MAGTTSISGVVSGIKSDDIISKLMELAKAPVTRMQTQQAKFQIRINVWQELNTRILALKSKSETLANPATFKAMNAVSSNTDALAVSASNTAEVGSYFMKINSLAKTHQIKSQGFADTTTTTVGTGILALGISTAPKKAISPLEGKVDSVTLSSDTALTTGSQSLVIDAVATSATRELTGTYAGADETAARTADAGSAGTITINGKDFVFDDSATLGDVVDAINLETATTGVTASITGSADDWHVTLTQQARGSDKEVVYAEDSSILNGGAAGDFTVTGNDALAHIGAVVFDAGTGDILQNAAGDIIVLNSSATAGTIDNAFDVIKGTAITIDSTNNTLAGIRNAINAANAGVTASIVNDGTEGSPYRLLVTSKTSGTVGEITLDASRLSGGTNLSLSTLQAAQNASITLGEGAGAVTVTKSSNTITDMIQGVTLNLKEADENKSITLNLTRNTDSAKTAVKSFVEQFNNLVDYINPQFKFDLEAGTTGALFGDAKLQSLLSDLRSKIGSPLTGVDQNIKLLSQIGIRAGAGDKLTLDESKLDEVLRDNLDQVQNLFARQGSTSDIHVSYVSCTTKTTPSSTSGYPIFISQAATQSYVVAGGKLTSPLAQNETLTVNGSDILLTKGMSQGQIVAKINTYTDQTGITASISDGALKLTNTRFGDKATIGVLSNISANLNAGANSGFGNLPVTDSNPGGQFGFGSGSVGLNVAGTINGEAATGNGQFLTSDEDNPVTSGLMIKYTGTGTGSYGAVNFTRGIGGILSDFGSALTASTTGTIAMATTNLMDQISSISKDIEAMNARLAVQESRLTMQFNAMETAMSTLKAQGDRLAAQLSSMTGS